jgi:hypothetical protein
MNPEAYKFVRLLKVASHNAAGGQWQGVESTSNFKVKLGYELQKLGSVAAVSVDSVMFPNLFDNVSAPNSTLLARTYQDLTTDLVGTGIAAQDFSVFWINGDYNNALIAASTNTSQVVFNFNNNYIPNNLALRMSVSPTGVLQLSSEIPFILTSSNWALYGFQTSSDTVYNNVYYGYPVNPAWNAFREVTVPDGFYDNFQLGNAVTALLDTAFSTPGAWSINPLLGAMDQRYLLQNSVAPFIITPIIPPSGIHDDQRYLWFQMGFVNYSTAYASSLQADVNPELFGLNVVYLYTNMLTSSEKAFSGEGLPDPTISTIPITVEYGFLQTEVLNQWNGPFYRFASGVTPQDIDVSLRNVYGEILALPPNQQMVVTFKLWFEGASIHQRGTQGGS